MQKLKVIDMIDATHAKEPGQMRAELVAQLAPRSVTPGFGGLEITTSAALTPAMQAARAQIAAAKHELGIA
jgi:copper homeostasis protein CutC